MSDFDSRPKGTVIHGAFPNFHSAERALRVLKNAGYLRSEFDPRAAFVDSGSTVVTVDAAATGAVRAAEILEEFGAELRYDRASEAPSAANAQQPALDGVAPLVDMAQDADAAPNAAVRPERKPRIRKSTRQKVQPPAPSAASIIIKTRGSDVMPLGESFTSTETLNEES